MKNLKQTSNAQQTTPKQSGYIPMQDGEKLYYESYGNGKPVIFLHGISIVGINYLLPQIPEFLAKDNQVILYDQRGMARSIVSNEHKDTVNIEQYIEDLDAIRQYFNYDKMPIIGHSFGSALAMHYAIKYPQYVESLVLITSSAATYKEQSQIQNFIDQLEQKAGLSQKTPEDPIEMMKLLQARRSIFLCDKNNIEKMNYYMDPALLPSSLENLGMLTQSCWLNEGFNLVPELEKLNIKTTVIHATNDVIIPESTSKEIALALNAEYLEIDTGHDPHIEPAKTVTIYKNLDDQSPVTKNGSELFTVIGEFINCDGA